MYQVLSFLFISGPGWQHSGEGSCLACGRAGFDFLDPIWSPEQPGVIPECRAWVGGGALRTAGGSSKSNPLFISTLGTNSKWEWSHLGRDWSEIWHHRKGARAGRETKSALNNFRRVKRKFRTVRNVRTWWFCS